MLSYELLHFGALKSWFSQKLEVLSHQNVNTFVGASVDAPHVCLCWEYASKGSLNDILWNDSIQLDEVFKFSICSDVVKVRNLFSTTQTELQVIQVKICKESFTLDRGLSTRDGEQEK